MPRRTNGRVRAGQGVADRPQAAGRRRRHPLGRRRHRERRARVVQREGAVRAGPADEQGLEHAAGGRGVVPGRVQAVGGHGRDRQQLVGRAGLARRDVQHRPAAVVPAQHERARGDGAAGHRLADPDRDDVAVAQRDHVVEGVAVGRARRVLTCPCAVVSAHDQAGDRPAGGVVVPVPADRPDVAVRGHGDRLEHQQVPARAGERERRAPLPLGVVDDGGGRAGVAGEPRLVGPDHVHAPQRDARDGGELRPGGAVVALDQVAGLRVVADRPDVVGGRRVDTVELAVPAGASARAGHDAPRGPVGALDQRAVGGHVAVVGVADRPRGRRAGNGGDVLEDAGDGATVRARDPRPGRRRAGRGRDHDQGERDRDRESESIQTGG